MKPKPLSAANVNSPAPATRWVKQGCGWYLVGADVVYRLRKASPCRVRWVYKNGGNHPTQVSSSRGLEYWAVARCDITDGCASRFTRVDSFIRFRRAKMMARKYLYRELGYEC